MKSLLPLLCLVGCVSVPFADRRSSDIQCGTVGPVAVTLRAWSGTDCPTALRAVRAALTPDVSGPWSVFVTGGYAGFDGVTLRGVTYPADRVIVVESGALWALKHELGHAADFDQGRPNTRDGR